MQGKIRTDMLVESRIRGDVYVRFGGEFLKTYRRNTARRRILSLLLYFHIETINSSAISFDLDFINFKVVDKKILKRTAIQEQVITPLRAHNFALRVDGKNSQSTVFALPKFTLPDDKQLVIELSEKNGGRNQVFIVENSDLIRAVEVDELKVK